MEAKVAWYEPAAGSSFNVRTAKAMPTDSREIESESSNLGSTSRKSACTSLAILAALFLLMAEPLPEGKIAQTFARIFPLSSLSPQILFRPPPAR